VSIPEALNVVLPHQGRNGYDSWGRNLTVDFLEMPNLDNADNQTHIGDLIDDPIRSLADAVLIIMAGKFFTAGRSRIGGKILNALDNAETVFLGG